MLIGAADVLEDAADDARLPISNQQLSWSLLGGEIQRQAATMAYDDIFYMLTLAFAFFMPFIFFLGGRAKQGGPVGH